MGEKARLGGEVTSPRPHLERDRFTTWIQDHLAQKNLFSLQSHHANALDQSLHRKKSCYILGLENLLDVDI